MLLVLELRRACGRTPAAAARRGPGFQVGHICAETAALLASGCGALGKSPNVPEPQCPHMQSEDGVLLMGVG